MTRATRAIPTDGLDASRDAGTLGALLETTKPGITKLVTITAMVGFVLGVLEHGIGSVGRVALLGAACLIGTAMAAGGANALNMWLEMERDRSMHRTRSRPLPSNRLEPGHAAWFGSALTIGGVLVLAAVGGPMPALVALACAAVYVFAYTPLKPITAWNTLIGAIPGALPPLIGTAAASPERGFGALTEPIGWALFALMMVWQLPHFFAIAWLHREDYARGGFRMLSVRDDTGMRTGAAILVTAVALVPATLAPVWAAPGLIGWAYGVIALATGLAYVWMALRFARERTDRRARGVFFASIIHLPVLMLALVGEGVVRSSF